MEDDLKIDADNKVKTFGHLNMGLQSEEQFISSIKKRYQELENHFNNPERALEIQKIQQAQNNEIKT